MNSEEFRDLLNRFEAGECTKEEEQLINAWYKSIGNNETGLPQNTEALNATVKSRLWAGIKSEIGVEQKASDHSPSQRPMKKTVYWWYKIAASVALGLLGSAAIFYYNKNAGGLPWQQETPPAVTTVTLANTFSEPLLALLSDGSEVILYPGSEINYPDHFALLKREVTLSGKAFFDVSKDSNRPFLVYTQEVVTKVLGTSFTVQAYSQEKEITVAVKTGKVSVSASPRKRPGSNNSLSQEIILTPNQQAVYSKLEERVEKKEIANPTSELTKPVSYNMQYEEAPVSRILQVLEGMYGAKIVFHEQELAGCSLTTSMTDENLEERIKIICTAIGADYVIGKDSITIKGYGCI